MTIRLTFEIGTDVDIAQVQTQNREKLAEPQLPPEVVRQGISVKKVSPDLLAVVALSSSDPRHDTVFLSNYAILRVIDNIKRLKGVGDAYVFGQQNYSMRLILDPIRMAQLSLTTTDIANVVREQNRDFPAGMVGREPAPKGTELTIPVITQQPAVDPTSLSLGLRDLSVIRTQVVTLGGHVTLTVAATNSLANIGLSYQWRLNQTEISSATASSYTHNNAQCADLTDYVDWAEQVVAGCRGGNAALDRMFDDTVKLARSCP